MSQELIQQAHFEEQPAGTVIPVDPSEKAQQEHRTNVPVAHELAKEQAKTDQSVTPEYLAWLESLYPARNGVGGNEALRGLRRSQHKSQ